MNSEDILKPDSLVYAKLNSPDRPLTVDNPKYKDLDINTIWSDEDQVNYSNKQKKKSQRYYQFSNSKLYERIVKSNN